MRKQLWFVVLFLLISASYVKAQSTRPESFQPPLSADRFQKPSQIEKKSDVTKQIQFTDWMLVCRKAMNATAAKKENCEIFNTVTLKGNKAPFAMTFVGRVEANQPLQITLLLPNNIATQNKPQILLDEKSPAILELTWTRCLPMGCFAGAALKDDVLKQMMASSKPGIVKFINGVRQEISFPISFKGLGPAIDALNKEDKTK